MLEMVVDYLLHIHLEQGLCPFHLEKREKNTLRVITASEGGKKSEQHYALMDEMYVTQIDLRFLIFAST